MPSTTDLFFDCNREHRLSVLDRAWFKILEEAMDTAGWATWPIHHGCALSPSWCRKLTHYSDAQVVSRPPAYGVTAQYMRGHFRWSSVMDAMSNSPYYPVAVGMFTERARRCCSWVFWQGRDGYWRSGSAEAYCLDGLKGRVKLLLDRPHFKDLLMGVSPSKLFFAF